jgi:predicted anti-sigma-YlaC factor YlaD
MSAFRPTAMLCDRAREWASLRLDGELSELEGALLDSHLDRCAACRTVAAETEVFTRELRAAPLEPIPRPLAIPRRQAAFRAARVSAAAAVMLVAAGLGSVFATSVQTSAPTTQHLAVASAEAPTDDRQLRDMRRAQLRIERALLQTNSRASIGNVT